MKHKDVILFLSAMCILVFAWIGFSIYHVSVTSTIEEPLQIQIIGIKPTFDTKTIEKLKQREKVIPLLEGGGTVATPSGTPAVTATPTPTVRLTSTPATTATPSATPTQSLLLPASSGTSSL